MAPPTPLTGRAHASSASSTSSLASSDIRPALDSILHDTFNISRATPPGTPRSITPKPPSYMVRGQRPRPHVTLHTWQSLDGQSVDLGPESMTLSERLRCKHDAIIGEGELVDGKRVYLQEHFKDFVDAASHKDGMDKRVDDAHQGRGGEGTSVVVKGIIVTASDPEECPEQLESLRGAGYRIYRASSMKMEDVLETLYMAGVKKLVVEGRMVESLLTASLYDKLLVSIVPIYTRSSLFGAPHRLANVHCELLGSEVVITAEPELC